MGGEEEKVEGHGAKAFRGRRRRGEVDEGGGRDGKEGGDKEGKERQECGARSGGERTGG